MVTYRYVDSELINEMINYRRNFHKYPEIGWTEYQTSALIARKLAALGFEVYMGKAVCDVDSRMGLPDEETWRQCEKRALDSGVPMRYMEQMAGGHTGVIGIIRGKKGRKKYAIRFDMDALPIQEADTGRNRTYKSLYTGCMHACGHDGHMAAGLGLAEILSRNAENIEGEIRLIFQPAEEGCRGAQAIVNRGWLDDVDIFYGGHIGIGCRETGMVGACTDGFFASTKLNILFHGRAAHAANAPEKGRNALLAAADFTVKAYQYYNQHSEDTRMNVGRLVSGSGRNIIADEAYLEAETRGMTDGANRKMQSALARIAEETAQIHDVKVEIYRVGDVGTGKSNRELIEEGRKAAGAMGIGERYMEEAIFDASEDVVTMMNRVQEKGGKAVYFMFGSELTAEHHQKDFDFDEGVLPIMAEFYARVLIKNTNRPYRNDGI